MARGAQRDPLASAGNEPDHKGPSGRYQESPQEIERSVGYLGCFRIKFSYLVVESVAGYVLRVLLFNIS